MGENSKTDISDIHYKFLINIQSKISIMQAVIWSSESGHEMVLSLSTIKVCSLDSLSSHQLCAFLFPFIIQKLLKKFWHAWQFILESC